MPPDFDHDRARLHGRRRRFVACTLAVAALVGAATAPLAGAQGPSASAVAACIANNGIRYSEPDSAVVSQYLSVASACRAALTEDASADVTFTADRQRSSRQAGSAPSGGAPAPATAPGDAARPPSTPSPPAPTAAGRPAPTRTPVRARGEDVAFVQRSLATADEAASTSVRPAFSWSSLGANGFGWILGAGIFAGAGLFFLRRMDI